MLHGRRSRVRNTVVRTGAVLAAVVLPAVALGIGASSASAAPVGGAAPTPISTPISTSTQTAVLDTNNVYAQTGDYFFQDGVVDEQRDVLYLADATDTDASALVRIDLATGASTSIPLGGGYAASDVAVSPLDGTVYVTHNTAPNPSISVLDPDVTYTASSLPPQIALATNHPQRVEVASDGRVFVMHLDPEAITVIGASTGPDRMNVLQTMTDVETSGGVTAMDAVHQRYYIASENTDSVTVIDAAATPATVLGVIALDKTPVGITWDSSSDQLALTFDDNTLSWLAPAADFSSAVVTRTETLAPLPAGVAEWSLPRALSVRADGTAIVLTEVFPTEVDSFVSVVPPVVDAETPVVPLAVGSDGYALVPDSRAGGSVYVTNIGNGTVSTIGEVTLNGYATSHTEGTDGQATASLVRADGFPLAATLTFTAASGAVFSAETGSDGFAAAAIPGLAVGDAAFGVSVAEPDTLTLSADSRVTTVAAAVVPAAPSTPTPIGPAGQNGPGALAATGLPVGIAAVGVVTLFALGLGGILVARRTRIRA